MSELHDRIPEIKRSFSVIAEFISDYPDHAKGVGSGRTRATVRCPFHGDRRPSMMIDQDGFRCNSCGANGDIIEYVVCRDNISTREAIESLWERLHGPASSRPKPKHVYPQEKKTYLTMNEVVSFERNIEVARPFFQKRHVFSLSETRHRLGADLKAVNVYQALNGEKFYHECPRYVIPNIWGGKVMGINKRRDDEKCKEILLANHHGRMLEIIKDIAKKWELDDINDVSVSDAIDEIFGHKYKQQRGSMTRMFNAGRVVDFKEDGTWRPIDLSYVMIVEGELDAMSLEEEGYPAVAVKYTNGTDLTKAFQGVTQIYIVRDNDKPGRDNAIKIWEHLNDMNRQNVQIIKPPTGYKDANEVIIADMAPTWLVSGYRIKPTMETKRYESGKKIVRL